MSLPSRRFRTPALVSEAWSEMMSLPVRSVITGLIVAAVCGVALATTGQTVQAEAQVLSRIDEVGTRLVVLTDVDGQAGILSRSVERVSHLSDVEWVVGVGYASDVSVVGLPAGNRVPMRSVHGTLPDDVVTGYGEWPPGTGLAGVDALAVLGLEHPAGGLVRADSGELIAIVGWLTASGPLSFLRDVVAVAPAGGDGGEKLRATYILAEDASKVDALSDAALAVLEADRPQSVRVDTSETLGQIRAALQGDLGQFSRRLVILILGVGLVLVALSTYGSITARKRDFGRRRAVGARRADIAVIVTAATIMAATVGALVGSTVGSILVWRWTSAPPDLSFTIAIAYLAIASAAAAAIPPALVAAYRDPLKVLRVP